MWFIWVSPRAFSTAFHLIIQRRIGEYTTKCAWFVKVLANAEVLSKSLIDNKK
jgi:hypothetical protein